MTNQKLIEDLKNAANRWEIENPIIGVGALRYCDALRAAAYHLEDLDKQFADILRRTAEDDKAREEGRLVVFPFREGEPRYTIEKREPCQEESGYVCECLYPENDDCVECRISHGTPYVREYTSDSLRIAKRSIEQYYDAIGKTVFLTHQEAEAALGGGEGG